MITDTIERRARDLVNREVQCCMSSLISELTRIGAGTELLEQAAELAAPIPDYEEAARVAGWRQDAPKAGIVKIDAEGVTDYAASWEDACAQSGIDPYDREVFEHWAVARYLAADLLELGEKVDMDFAGLCIWARTTTGQALACDDVICRVVELADERDRPAIAPSVEA